LCAAYQADRQPIGNWQGGAPRPIVLMTPGAHVPKTRRAAGRGADGSGPAVGGFPGRLRDAGQCVCLDLIRVPASTRLPWRAPPSSPTDPFKNSWITGCTSTPGRRRSTRAHRPRGSIRVLLGPSGHVERGIRTVFRPWYEPDPKGDLRSAPSRLVGELRPLAAPQPPSAFRPLLGGQS